MTFSKITIDGTEYELKAIPKVVEKDYEILIGSIGTDNTTTSMKILSVKWLSDNEIFTVGDEIEGKDNKPPFGVIITGFHVFAGTMFVFYENANTALSAVKKTKKHTPLFTTEDGKKIYESDEYWVVFDFNINHYNAKSGHHNYYADKIFYSEEAAKDYVLMNKPCLSLTDLLNNWYSWEQHSLQCLSHSVVFYRNETENNNPLFKQFKELAKQKINKP